MAFPSQAITTLETSTTQLGAAFHKFASTTCESYVTKDLPSKEAVRGQHQAALAQKKDTNRNKKTDSSSSAQERKFNLSTYKPHSLPDYAAYIRLNGTTDGFTNRVVSNL